MQKLVAIIIQAIAVVFGLRTHVAELNAENESLRAQIAADAAALKDLQDKIDQDQPIHDALKAAADAATARAETAEANAADLKAQEAEAISKADELAAAINEHEDTPNITADFRIAA